MNRLTVVLLALAILVAHALAIHQTPGGDFAPPYDQAHVAYRLGRNLVHLGAARWEAGNVNWVEAYPSTAWVFLAAAAERVYFFPTTVAQVVGILSVLATIVVLTQFSANRMAGLIAPVLTATTGAVAASAASGTEAPLAMLLFTASFLAFERGWRRPLFLCLILFGLTRPEGVAIAVLFLVLEIFDRPLGQDPDEHRPPRGSMLATLLWTLGATLVLWVVRGLWTGLWIGNHAQVLLEPEGPRLRLGLAYLAGFLESTPAVLLLLLPLVFVAVRRATGIGRRALALFLGWTLLVALAGGDDLPFSNAMAPALPLAFLSIQCEVTGWLDRTPRHSPAAWFVLVATVVASLLASKLPGDLGPVPLERYIRSWMKPGEALARSYPRPLGREGLLDELREVERLRTVGLFLRDKVEPDARISTFWPGAIGYLSRRRVFDLLGRTNAPPGKQRVETWQGRPRVDLVAALSEPADYLVVSIGVGSEVFPDALYEWLERYDVDGDTPERRRAARDVLEGFELVTVPIPATEDASARAAGALFFLLRARPETPPTRLELRGVEEPERFRVMAHHDGHRLVADLSVRCLTEDGRELWLEPTGSWAEDARFARTGLLLYDTGPRALRLLEAELPAGVDRATVTARLHTSGLPPSSRFGWMEAPAERAFSR